jgi:hypothetical protein
MKPPDQEEARKILGSPFVSGEPLASSSRLATEKLEARLTMVLLDSSSAGKLVQYTGLVPLHPIPPPLANLEFGRT